VKKAAPAQRAAPVKKAAPIQKAARAGNPAPARNPAGRAAKPPARTAAANGKANPKSAPAKKATAAAIAVPQGSEWTQAELTAIRTELVAELNEMRDAYDRSMRDLNDLQQSSTDGAGDDQADAGSKTFEREQEQSIAANRLDLLTQIQRAVERIDAGTYGFCESCGNPIPKARLKAFPSATLDVACKQREERR
jgi:RNA polymerase-binding protein DksA